MINYPCYTGERSSKCLRTVTTIGLPPGKTGGRINVKVHRVLLGSISTQREAFEHARDVARREGGEVLIQNRNNLIRERNTYGKADPFPPKG